MSTSDERLKILNMIQEGKITPQEGLALLDQLTKLDQKTTEVKESLKNMKDELKTSLKEERKAAVEKGSAEKAAFKAEIQASIEESKASAREAVKEAHEFAQKVREQKLETDETRKTFAETSSRGPRYFHLSVTDTHTGKSRVDVRMPVGVITAGVKLGAHFSPEIHGMDTNHLLEMISEGDTGKVMDIVDDDDCEHVVVTLE
jgi:DUF4097 and DUF4098 domain-containing protein YvlB